MKCRLHEYQRRALDFILTHKAAGLFLDMGLGKTVITLTAIDLLLHDYFDVSRVLVIAPLRVAEDTWSREADKWDHLRHLRISRVIGPAKRRGEALARDADVYVVNRECVAWLVEYLEERRIRWPFDMIVIDELSSFKNPQAKRFKALRRVRPMAERIVGLTGTPAANSLMDLWAEMYLLDRGERLGRTLTAYRGNFFRPGCGSGYVVYRWEPRRGALEEITGRIADITVSMRAEDYLELPERIDTVIGVQLDDQAMTAYREMERENLLEFDSDVVAALDAGALTSKLLQMANGFVYDEAHGAHRIHSAKTDAPEEIVEAADGPVLVFYSFREDRDELARHFGSRARALETDADIADWNAGRIPVLLAHPASVGYGLNLQDGGHVIAWYGLPWSLEQYSQANARLHRQGQDKPVLVYQIIAAGTVDEDVRKSLASKDTTQSALIGILNERRRAYT